MSFKKALEYFQVRACIFGTNTDFNEFVKVFGPVEHLLNWNIQEKWQKKFGTDDDTSAAEQLAKGPKISLFDYLIATEQKYMIYWFQYQDTSFKDIYQYLKKTDNLSKEAFFNLVRPYSNHLTWYIDNFSDECLYLETNFDVGLEEFLNGVYDPDEDHPISDYYCQLRELEEPEMPNELKLLKRYSC